MKTKIIIASLAIATVLTSAVGIASAQTTFKPTSSDFYAQIQSQLDAVRTQMNNLLSSLGSHIPPTSGTVKTSANANMVSGVVKSISGNTIIVTGKNGVEYTINAANASINGGNGSLSGIVAGMTITAGGTFANGSTTTLDATTIKVAAARTNTAGTAVLHGTISAISGSTFTVQSICTGAAANIVGYVGSANSVVVSTNSNTLIRKNGKTASFSDLALGQNVIVNGVMTSNSTALAENVYVNVLNALSRAINITTKNGIGGTVESISGNTIKVTGFNNTEYTVDAGSATITKSDKAMAQVSDIKAGDMIGVTGVVNGTSVTAERIYVMAAGSLDQSYNYSTVSGNGTVSMFSDVLGMVSSSDGTNGSGADVSMPVVMFNGTVKSISGSTLVVNGYNNTNYTVDATNATVTDKNGQKSTLSIVAVGDSVIVAGKKDDATVTATMVGDLSK